MIEFLSANWLWMAFLIAMVALHRHGGCGHAHRGPHDVDDRLDHPDDRSGGSVHATGSSHETRRVS